MKMVKGLLLGTAAGFVAMSGAQAADLPVKAKAVEYVKICSLYGAGFYYIPGTDTCIKFGGYLRFDVTGNGNVYNGPAWNGTNGARERFAHDFQSRSRFALTVDLRTATQYGVVRVFGQSDWQFSTYGAAGGIAPAFVSGAVSPGTGGLINNDTPGNGYVAVEQAFVQFAGFTFGKSISARAVPWNGYMGNNNTSFFLGGPDYVTGVNNIQYTYQWGNGVSTSIGLDEGIVFNRTSLANTNNATSATFGQGNVYGGQSVPDIVGNFKIDQAWGIFTVAAGMNQVRAGYNATNNTVLPQLGGPLLGIPINGNELSGSPENKFGYSVTGGLQIKNLPTGPGDTFTVDATYAKGDTKAVISTSAASPSFAIFGDGIPGVTHKSVGFGYTSDGVFTGSAAARTTMPIQLTTAYGVRAAFIHNWNAQWQSSVFGGYSKVDYNAAASAALCTQYSTNNANPANVGTAPPVRAGVAGLNATYTCNPDFAVYQVGFRTGWTPLAGLTFSAEYLYSGLDQRFTGQAVLAPLGSKPTTVYNFKDQDTHSVNFRVQRNF